MEPMVTWDTRSDRERNHATVVADSVAAAQESLGDAWHVEDYRTMRAPGMRGLFGAKVVEVRLSRPIVVPRPPEPTVEDQRVSALLAGRFPTPPFGPVDSMETLETRRRELVRAFRAIPASEPLAGEVAKIEAAVAQDRRDRQAETAATAIDHVRATPRPLRSQVEQRRRALGMDIDALADLSCVNRRTLVDIEDGRVVPTAATLGAIAFALDASWQLVATPPTSAQEADAWAPFTTATTPCCTSTSSAVRDMPPPAMTGTPGHEDALTPPPAGHAAAAAAALTSAGRDTRGSAITRAAVAALEAGTVDVDEDQLELGFFTDREHVFEPGAFAVPDNQLEFTFDGATDAAGVPRPTSVAGALAVLATAASLGRRSGASEAALKEEEADLRDIACDIAFPQVDPLPVDIQDAYDGSVTQLREAVAGGATVAQLRAMGLDLSGQLLRIKWHA